MTRASAIDRAVAEFVRVSHWQKVKAGTRALLEMGPFEQRARLISLIGRQEPGGLLCHAIEVEMARGALGDHNYDDNRLIGLRSHWLLGRFLRRQDSAERYRDAAQPVRP